MQIDLSGKKIIVTGASSGIGLAMAQSLAQSGATLAVQYFSGLKGIKSLRNIFGEKIKAFQADLGNTEACIKFFEDVMVELETIDAIVLNAGIFEEHPTNLDNQQWLEVWHKTIQVNLDAVGILTKLSIEHFKNQMNGRIIYISSRAAFRGETEENLAYAASKGGVVSLARTVARSFGTYGIKSVIIAPGFTQTPMAEKHIKAIGEEKLKAESAIKKITQPQDIAPLINLIAAGLMDHATGSTIDFNGGSYIH